MRLDLLRRTTIAIVGFLLLVYLGLGVSFFRNQQVEAQLYTDLYRAGTTWQQLQARAKDDPEALQRQIEETRARVNARLAGLPPASEMNTLLDRLLTWVRHSQVTINSVQTGPVTEWKGRTGTYRQQRISLQVQGSLTNVVGLLQRLEQSGISTLQIENLHLTTVGTSSQLDFDLVVYVP